MEKVKDLPTRRWYMEQTLVGGWSRNVLALQIEARAHARHGKAVSNFAALLPAPQGNPVPRDSFEAGAGILSRATHLKLARESCPAQLI